MIIFGIALLVLLGIAMHSAMSHTDGFPFVGALLAAIYIAIDLYWRLA